MAQHYLDNILDCLKLVPLDLSRSLQLMKHLDDNVMINNDIIDKNQNDVLNIFNNKNTIDLNDSKQLDDMINKLELLHDKYNESYNNTLEKVSISHECRDKINCFIQRINEDSELIENEDTHGYITSSINYINNELNFDSTFSSKSQSIAASKGLMSVKQPKFDDLDSSNNSLLTSSQYAPPRRRAANNAIDNMIRSSAAVSMYDEDDNTDDDEYSTTLDKNTQQLQINTSNTMTSTMNDAEFDNVLHNQSLKTLQQQSAAMYNTSLQTTQYTEDVDQTPYCLCNQPSYGEMVGCDNDTCPIQWFHLPCVGLKKAPKGEWICPICTGEMKYNPTR